MSDERSITLELARVAHRAWAGVHGITEPFEKLSLVNQRAWCVAVVAMSEAVVKLRQMQARAEVAAAPPAGTEFEQEQRRSLRKFAAENGLITPVGPK